MAEVHLCGPQEPYRHWEDGQWSPLAIDLAAEEEATFLATQQIDEARHMQLCARFQDELVADPAATGTHVERAREQISPASAPGRSATSRSAASPAAST